MFWKKGESEPTPSAEDTLKELADAVRDPKALRTQAETRAQNLDLELFPKEMSCMTCLDELMSCMSLGGQVRNYYRYGDLTLCDRQNEKLNFCFSQSMKTGAERERNVQEFYKKRLVAELSRGSSEDIWEARR